MGFASLLKKIAQEILEYGIWLSGFIILAYVFFFSGWHGPERLLGIFIGILLVVWLFLSDL